MKCVIIISVTTKMAEAFLTWDCLRHSSTKLTASHIGELQISVLFIYKENIVWKQMIPHEANEIALMSKQVKCLTHLQSYNHIPGFDSKQTRIKECGYKCKLHRKNTSEL